MSRSNTAANTTASQQQHVRPIVFVEFRFDSGALYLHNGVGTYVWGQDQQSPPQDITWTGVGALGEISEIEETDQITPFRVAFRLNAFDSAIADELDSEEVFERLAIIYLGYLNDAGNLEADPDERWRGYMDNSSIQLGGNDGIVLNAENELIRNFTSNGALFTDEDQQERYSGDTGFQFLDQMIDAQIHWGPGGETVSVGGGGTFRDKDTYLDPRGRRAKA